MNTTFTELRNELGFNVMPDKLTNGDFVRITLEAADDTERFQFGLFRGIENTGIGPFPEYLKLEVANYIVPNTIPRNCSGVIHRFSLVHVELIEIMAPGEGTACRILFDTIGALRLEYDAVRETMREIHRLLADV